MPVISHKVKRNQSNFQIKAFANVLFNKLRHHTRKSMVDQSGYFSFIVLRTTFFFLLKDLEQYQMMELKKEQEVMQVTY